MPAIASRNTRMTSKWSPMKAELRVERDVLGEVPRRVVRLGAEYRSHLVDTFEDADHRLLGELRALRQVSRPAEVVELEHVRAALGRRRDDLRRLDLDETEPVERGAVAGHRSGGDLERGPLPRMAKRDGGEIEQGRQLLLEHGPAELDRRRLRGLRQDREDRLAELDASGSLLAFGDCRLDLEHCLRQEPGDRVDRLRVLDHDLREAGAVAEQDEGQPGEPALVMEPAGESHAPTDLPAQIAGERPLHVSRHLPRR
jgi:hypothetical protein